MNTYQGYSITKQLSNTFRNKTMPFYNNTDAYTRKPRSYREARKRREASKHRRPACAEDLGSLR